MQEGKSIALLCSYSFQFPSKFLSNSIVLNRSNHVKEYSGKSRIEFFDEAEISKMSEDLKGDIHFIVPIGL